MSILHLPFLPVLGFVGETADLTAHRKRLREAKHAAMEKAARAEFNYSVACSSPRAAMAEGD